MKATFVVRIVSSPQIIKLEGEKEEIIYGNNNYISISKAENIVKQLNNGSKLEEIEF